jgi:hypothetical protein
MKLPDAAKGRAGICGTEYPRRINSGHFSVNAGGPNRPLRIVRSPKTCTDAIPWGFCPFSVQLAGKTDAENPQVNR